MIRKCFTSCLALFFLISYSLAIPPIVLRDSETFYEIGDKVSFFEDSSSSLFFSDVILKGEIFKKSTLKIPTWGVTRSAIWVKFSVANNSANPDWNLEIGYPTIHELDFYKVNADGSFTHRETGSNVYFDSSAIRSNHIIIPLTIGKGEQHTFYLRAKSRNGLRLPLRIETMQTLYEKNHPVDLVNSIYFGLIIALTIYNLFIYLKLKDITYLYYVLYIFFFGLNISYLQGYGFEFIDNKLYAWNGGMSIIFGTLFSVSFLRLKHYSSFLYYLQWVPLGFVILAFILYMTGNYTSGFRLIVANPAFIYTLLIGIVVYRKGFKPAKLYVGAFAALVASVVFFVLTGYRVFPANFITEHIMQIGSGIEALTLSLALAYKFDFYRKEKRDIQEQALRQSTEFSHQLIQSQENERKRIAAELHDSLGQKMILLKNRMHSLKMSIEKRGGDIHSVEELTQSISDTIQEVRSISYELRPFQLDLLGLTQSIQSLLEEFLEEHNIQINVEIDSVDGIFSRDNEINIYRIIQSILGNTFRFSGAKEGTFFIHKKQDFVHIHIEDYGEYFGEDYWKGFEFSGIKERVNILKGKIAISKAIPQGTYIEISIPYSNPR